MVLSADTPYDIDEDVAIDDNIAPNEFGFRVGRPSHDAGWTRPPRRYSSDEVGIVLNALASYMVEQQLRPTMMNLAISVMKYVRDLTGRKWPGFLSKADVWFICRDHLRNRLGYITWERQEPGGFSGKYSKSPGIVLTTLGMQATQLEVDGPFWRFRTH